MKPRPYQYVLGVALLLLPCVWRAHIYAGDLSSHIYNAWLTTLIESGQAPGLSFHPIHTNLIFDILLETLFKRVGADWAQRIAVGCTVLLLASGSMLYMRSVGGRRAWFLFPLVAMICYGWVFHMGFMNYLISAGFSLMALSLLAKPRPAAIAGAVVLLALAFSAHLFPVLWAISMAAYRFLHALLKPRRTLALLGLSLVAIVGLRSFLMWRFEGAWSVTELLSATASDQFWVFGLYTIIFVPFILVIWGSLLYELIHARSGLRILLGFPAQSVILSAAGACLLPYFMSVPGYPWGFGFTPQRISLLLAVSICALLSAAKPRVPELVLITGVGVAYFISMFVNDGQLSRFEDRLTKIVDRLPPNSRVVTALHVPWRTNQLDHPIDRVCVLRCISYADYEPVTGQFRIQTDGKSPLMAPDYTSFYELQQGTYKPPPGSPDYYLITACPPAEWGIDAPLCVEYVKPPR